MEHFFIVYYTYIVYTFLHIILCRLTTIMLMSLHTKKYWLLVKIKHYFRSEIFNTKHRDNILLAQWQSWNDLIRSGFLTVKQHFRKAFSQYSKFKGQGCFSICNVFDFKICNFWILKGLSYCNSNTKPLCNV